MVVSVGHIPHTDLFHRHVSHLHKPQLSLFPFFYFSPQCNSLGPCFFQLFLYCAACCRGERGLNGLMCIQIGRVQTITKTDISKSISSMVTKSLLSEAEPSDCKTKIFLVPNYRKLQSLLNIERHILWDKQTSAWVCLLRLRGKSEISKLSWDKSERLEFKSADEPTRFVCGGQQELANVFHFLWWWCAETAGSFVANAFIFILWCIQWLGLDHHTKFKE